MEESIEAPQCGVSVVVDGAMSNAQCAFISPWPEMETAIDASSIVDYEQYEPPKELLLLLDEAQTPAEIQKIVLDSLKRPQQLVPRSGEHNPAEGPSATPIVVDVPESGESSQVHSGGSQPRTSSDL